MLRTALGPDIAAWLDDPGVVEVMLNPDGRLWIYRLKEGVGDTGQRLSAPTASASFASSRTTSEPRSIPATRACQPSCRRAASASRG